MRCGVLSVKSQTNAGYGMRLIIILMKSLHTILVNEKIRHSNALQKKLSCFDIDFYYTDDWGAYDRNLPAQKHLLGKRHTQAIERKHLTLRTRIKRLARRTICFSKLEKMHDIVIGLFINRYEFGVAV